MRQASRGGANDRVEDKMALVRFGGERAEVGVPSREN